MGSFTYHIHMYIYRFIPPYHHMIILCIRLWSQNVYALVPNLLPKFRRATRYETNIVLIIELRFKAKLFILFFNEPIDMHYATQSNKNYTFSIIPWCFTAESGIRAIHILLFEFKMSLHFVSMYRKSIFVKSHSVSQCW